MPNPEKQKEKPQFAIKALVPLQSFIYLCWRLLLPHKLKIGARMKHHVDLHKSQSPVPPDR